MNGNATSFTRTSIYNYFQTKEEIFLALLQREYELWNGRLKEIQAGHEVTAISAAHSKISPCTGCVACGYNGPPESSVQTAGNESGVNEDADGTEASSDTQEPTQTEEPGGSPQAETEGAGAKALVVYRTA